MTDEQDVRLYDRTLHVEKEEKEKDERSLVDRLENKVNMELKPHVLAAEMAGGAAIAYTATGMVPVVGPILQRVAGKYIAGIGAAGGAVVYAKSNVIRRKDKKGKDKFLKD